MTSTYSIMRIATGIAAAALCWLSLSVGATARAAETAKAQGIDEGIYAPIGGIEQ